MSDVTLPEGAQTLAQWLDFDGLTRARKQRQRHRKGQHKTPPAFLDLPRRERRAQTVSVGWQIQSDGQGRGVFYDHIFLPGWKWPAEVTEADGVCLSAHPVFLAQGPQPAHYYRAGVVSVAQKFVSQIEDRAKAAIQAQLSETDRERLANHEGYYFLPQAGGSTLQISVPALRLASLGDRTLDGAQAEWLRAHWAHLATLETVHTDVQVNPSDRHGQATAHGVWVSITTAEPNLTVDALIRVIEDFRAHGETNQAPVAADFEPHRPIVEAMLRATLWRWDRKEAEAQGRSIADPTDPMVLAAFGYGSSWMRHRLRHRKRA